MVTFPFLIVCNTFSLHMLLKILIFIRHKDGFFKFPPLSGQYEKYPTTYEAINLLDFRVRTACCHSLVINHLISSLFFFLKVFNCLIAVIISLTTLKLTKLMRFNLRVSLFGMTLQRARPALAMFGVQFGIVFFAYVMVGCLVFGQNVSGFKSILWGSISLGRVILGKSQFLADLSRIDHVIGPLFFFTFVLFVSWILINMFMAILDDAYNRVRLECGTMSNEYEIIDFFLARFRAWFGVRKVKVPPRARWQNARLKVRGTDFISRRRLYLRSEEDIALEKTGDLLEKLEDSILNLENRVHLLYALDDVE